ncbi:MAG: dTDP-4-amino-4,6-dideoxygalactose transaminase [Gemmatimonadaceae bacterium]
MGIPFNRPAVVGQELDNIRQAIAAGHLSGDGAFTRRCNAWLEARTGAAKALLTHSCTAALEMAALLAEAGPGDEVIMPSFTFVSTANAFVLRGATPVFVEVRPDTLNLDETQVEAAVTERTRAIVPVHYAGVACEMDALMEIAARRGLLVIEDAAQALLATYKGRPLGTIGDLGALSFHETKNIISGEGGALLARDRDFIGRAEIIREKGTNRSSFFRGEVDKYTWVDVGSSYLPSEIIAAFLHAQLEQADALIARRLAIWERYHEAFADLEVEGLVRRPIIPAHCAHNGHLYYLLLPNLEARQRVLAELKALGIGAIFHYVPLDSSPAGRRYGRAAGPLPVTHDIADRLVRLPLWVGVEDRVDAVIDAARSSIGSVARVG